MLVRGPPRWRHRQHRYLGKLPSAGTQRREPQESRRIKDGHALQSRPSSPLSRVRHVFSLARHWDAVKLVFIYGPPAVGKLTVGKALAKQTGFRLFHNHLAIDAVKPVFDFGTPSFWKLVSQFRKEVLDEAAKEDIDTIFTFVYVKGEDDEYVKEIVRVVESHGGEACFVRLYCTPKKLNRRVANKSRKRIGKLTSRSALAELASKSDLTSEVPFAGSLSLDTTKASPQRVSAAIAKHFGLPIR